ncbi:AAA family ATPase [Roseofilum sp. BLCC_M154]|uniref:AAA family ATPase n=1 Tax=Roseofilum acuticapitatum BLCC-M154 TaxID=3022444 RepID=A0ABT7APM5_9CYAN|nr:AAA family ATPase [Roseofilum acuticapitatum]MDJ1168854.1 AAA family ATPase [Roseofilum acuticapitatum BLCC-M154]
MPSISGYQTLHLIYESSNSEVYRAIRESDQQRVILKLLKEDYPTPSELRRYKQEYKLTHSNELIGVVKACDLQPYKNTLVMILEDFGGESLKTLNIQQTFNLNQYLSLFIKIADCLGQLHSANIIHKDINPANIVFNPQTQELKIIDLGISTQLSKENPTLKNPTTLEGTLPYISPEQTGRMNRSLDYRTDFYSLGVTFYELLTHQLPFTTQDELELVHCHIAREPRSATEINPQIPPILSDIISKLMAKNAEDRYQSAWGLKADLETCLAQLEQEGKIDPFPLASQDLSDKFQIPQKLYGRQNEIEQLLNTFEQVDQHSQMVLVAGYSGIGKSALVQEIYKPITQRKGYFISGKFDQFQRNVPYSAIVSAFKGFVQQLLTESPEKLEQWKSKFLDALGVNGQVIVDVIPEMELIIGPQLPVGELEPMESQNRFNLVFQNFVHCCCSPKHPLAIFLDDLQWTDRATLKLIELIVMDKNLKNLLLIGAYRDNEVNVNHPFIMLVNKLKENQIGIHELTLKNLVINDVRHLIEDTVTQESENVQELSKIIFKKTQGNPFFVNQFLSNLYSENLIEFNYKNQVWEWDLYKIKSQNITDNVVELMIGKLRKLPLSTQEVLKLAACIGANFDLTTLSIVSEEPASDLFDHIIPAIQSGLVLSLSELDPELLIQDYRFVHDRVQQAAYALIAEEDKPSIHLKIGQLLLKSSSEEEQSEKLFEIVGHLNIGFDRLTNAEEKNKISQLNLEAGKKAKSSAAYMGSLEYLKAGMEQLSDDSWEKHYKLTFEFHKERCEVEYLNYNFDESERWADLTLQKAQSTLDKCEIHRLLCLQNTLSNKYEKAFASVIIGLELLEIDFPSPTADQTELQAYLEVEVKNLKNDLEDRKFSELEQAEECTDLEKQMAMKLLHCGTSSMFLTNPTMWWIVVINLVQMSLKYGLVIDSIFGFSAYGMFLANIQEEYALAYEFGTLAINLAERFNNGGSKCQVLHVFATYINGWNKHLKYADPMNNEGFALALEFGDIHYAGYTIMVGCYNLFYQGKPLEEMTEQIEKYLLYTEQNSHQLGTDLLWAAHLVILNLRGLTSDIDSFDDGEKAEEIYLNNWIECQNFMVLCYYYIIKSKAYYLYCKLDEALDCLSEAEKLLPFISISIPVAQHNFYSSLTLLRLYPNSDLESQQQSIEKVRNNQVRMKKWVDNCPENFLHKYLLVEAELARVLGNTLEAMDLYDRAIEAAHENDYVQEESLANELAAEFYLKFQKPKFAKIYIQQAYYGYRVWGAMAKTEQLEKLYPQLLGRSANPKQRNISITKISTSKNSTVALDLSTAIKANQAISGEIVLEKLLISLMNIIMQNAGAQSGYLLMAYQDKLMIEACQTLDSEEIEVLQSVPVEDNSCIAQSLINYVRRTQESVVLNDATNSGNFVNDPYIKQCQPKSILCVPLINQGKLVSIVYLENNLTTGAFTEDRVEMIKLLSGQAAIALENAYLYQNLEQKVQQRTAELALANQEIGILNEKLQAENLRLSSELDVAKKLQQMVLPKAEELEDIIGLDIAGYMEPADEVGGDYYDVLKQGERLKIGIGDVTGHGLESGVLMLMAQTAIRTLQKVDETDPVRFLDILNQTLYDNLQRMNSDKNMTLAILDYHQGRVQLSGQHEEAIVVRSHGEIELIDTMDLGFPIGLDDPITDFIGQQDIHLNPGDVMILYTDGITEAENRENCQYGLERLCTVVQEYREKSADEIRERAIADVQEFIGEQKVFDDITLVVLKQR